MESSASKTGLKLYLNTLTPSIQIDFQGGRGEKIKNT